MGRRSPLEQRVELGQWPSPVIDANALRDGLWIKNDGVCHPVYGGNKVRKLEYLLKDAGERLVTFGAAGSHHVLATALHGSATGHQVSGVLFARPWSVHAQTVLHATTGSAELHFHHERAVATQVFEDMSRECTSIPAGGSTPVGALGYVQAVLELADQIRAGLLPEPRRIFVPAGTAGTLAGLAVGVSLAGLSTSIVGVRVVPHAWLSENDAASLCAATAELVETTPASWHLDDGQLGGGYGESTAEAESAIERACGVGLQLETCYTGKALAAAIKSAGGPDLYWQTHNQISLEPLTRAVPIFDPAAWGWQDVAAQG